MGLTPALQDEFVFGQALLPPPNHREQVFLVDTVAYQHSALIHMAKNGFGARVLAFANCGLTTMLSAVHRTLLPARVFMFTCEVEPETKFQVHAFIRALPGAWNPKAMAGQLRESMTYCAEICAQRLVNQEIKFLLIDRVDLATPQFGEFLHGVLARCASKGCSLVTIVGQRMVHPDNPVFMPTDTTFLSANYIIGNLSVDETLDFIVATCRDGEILAKLWRNQEKEAVTAVGVLCRHHQGEIGKLARFSKLKNTLFERASTTPEVVRLIIDILDDPLRLIDVLPSLPPTS